MEARVLKDNLGNTKISDHEILYDMGQLKSLGQLQESLEWFSVGVTRLAERFNHSNMNAIGGLPQLSNNSVQTLMSLAKEFENIADTCLLVLHIEVRMEKRYQFCLLQFKCKLIILDSPPLLLPSVPDSPRRLRCDVRRRPGLD